MNLGRASGPSIAEALANTSMPEAVRTAPMPRNLLKAMQAAGLDTATLAKTVGLTSEQLETGLRFDELDRFLCAAWVALDDPAFGLKAGSIMKSEHFSVVGFAAMTSPTFGVSLARNARYTRLLWGDLHELHVEPEQTTVRMHPQQPERPYSQCKLDFELASLLTFGRVFTAQPIRPLQVGVRGPIPSYAAHYNELFDCPVRFEQPQHSITFSRRDLDRRLISANAAVAGLFERQAEAEISQWQDADIAARVRSTLRDMLRGDEPTLASVASALHLSSRTLQRRLTEAKVNFRELLDEARRELAEQYLRGGVASLMEISYLLGFADPNSFFRAFKRWTGMTPERYRSAPDTRRIAEPRRC